MRRWVSLSLVILLAGCVYVGERGRTTMQVVQPLAAHIVVISVDALTDEDFEQARQLPHFQALLARGTCIRNVQGVYPSLTYPAHATLLTGVMPIRHGIIANTRNQPGTMHPDWYWYYRDIRVPTIIDYARQAGLTVGTVLWPVCAGANVDYNCPEIWPNRPGEGSTWLALRYGTPWFILDVCSRYTALLRGKEQPYLDDFTTAVTIHMLSTRRPGLSLIHLTDLDTMKHRYGTRSPQAGAALIRQDQRLGQILQAIEEAGMGDDTMIVVLGDHGFLDVHTQINLNALLAEQGLVDVYDRGEIGTWRAIANSCDGSAHIYLHDRQDQQLRQHVGQLLNELSRNPAYGIETVYGQPDITDMGVSDTVDFIVEAREGYCFSNRWAGDPLEIVEPHKVQNGEQEYVATHGYAYSKPHYRTWLLFAGPGIKQGTALHAASLLDVAPTLLYVLGLPSQSLDGHVLTSLFVNNQSDR